MFERIRINLKKQKEAVSKGAAFLFFCEWWKIIYNSQFIALVEYQAFSIFRYDNEIQKNTV